MEDAMDIEIPMPSFGVADDGPERAVPSLGASSHSPNRELPPSDAAGDASPAIPAPSFASTGGASVLGKRARVAIAPISPAKRRRLQSHDAGDARSGRYGRATAEGLKTLDSITVETLEVLGGDTFRRLGTLLCSSVVLRGATLYGRVNEYAVQVHLNTQSEVRKGSLRSSFVGLPVKSCECTCGSPDTVCREALLVLRTAVLYRPALIVAEDICNRMKSMSEDELRAVILDHAAGSISCCDALGALVEQKMEGNLKALPEMEAHVESAMEDSGGESGPFVPPGDEKRGVEGMAIVKDLQMRVVKDEPADMKGVLEVLRTAVRLQVGSCKPVRPIPEPLGKCIAVIRKYWGNGQHRIALQGINEMCETLHAYVHTLLRGQGLESLMADVFVTWPYDQCSLSAYRGMCLKHYRNVLPFLDAFNLEWSALSEVWENVDKIIEEDGQAFVGPIVAGCEEDIYITARVRALRQMGRLKEALAFMIWTGMLHGREELFVAIGKTEQAISFVIGANRDVTPDQMLRLSSMIRGSEEFSYHALELVFKAAACSRRSSIWFHTMLDLLGVSWNEVVLPESQRVLDDLLPGELGKQPPRPWSLSSQCARFVSENCFDPEGQVLNGTKLYDYTRDVAEERLALLAPCGAEMIQPVLVSLSALFAAYASNLTLTVFSEDWKMFKHLYTKLCLEYPHAASAIASVFRKGVPVHSAEFIQFVIDLHDAGHRNAARELAYAAFVCDQCPHQVRDFVSKYVIDLDHICGPGHAAQISKCVSMLPRNAISTARLFVMKIALRYEFCSEDARDSLANSLWRCVVVLTSTRATDMIDPTEFVDMSISVIKREQYKAGLLLALRGADESLALACADVVGVECLRSMLPEMRCAAVTGQGVLALLNILHAHNLTREAIVLATNETLLKRLVSRASQCAGVEWVLRHLNALDDDEERLQYARSARRLVWRDLNSSQYHNMLLSFGELGPQFAKEVLDMVTQDLNADVEPPGILSFEKKTAIPKRLTEVLILMVKLAKLAEEGEEAQKWSKVSFYTSPSLETYRLLEESDAADREVVVQYLLNLEAVSDGVVELLFHLGETSAALELLSEMEVVVPHLHKIVFSNVPKQALKTCKDVLQRFFRDQIVRLREIPEELFMIIDKLHSKRILTDDERDRYRTLANATGDVLRKSVDMPAKSSRYYALRAQLEHFSSVCDELEAVDLFAAMYDHVRAENRGRPSCIRAISSLRRELYGNHMDWSSD